MWLKKRMKDYYLAEILDPAYPTSDERPPLLIDEELDGDRPCAFRHLLCFGA